MRESVRKSERGSLELVVISLLAALIIVLAIPVVEDIGTKAYDTPQDTTDNL